MTSIDPSLVKAYAKAFKQAKPDDTDTQITNFCFCSDSMTLPSGRRLETLLMAEPKLSAKHGLFFQLTFEAWNAGEDDCSMIFDRKLPPELSKSICLSKHPISDYLAAQPDALGRLMRDIPGLKDALALQHSEIERESITRSSPVPRASAKVKRM